MKTTRQSNQRQGIVFILSAPSGTGKTTVINGLRERFPEVSLSVSYTTRAPRSGDIPGRDYHFISRSRFSAMKAKGEFAEWATVHDFYYGTPRRPLDRSIGKGKDFFLDIDVQGARQIKKEYPQAVSIFLLPPSWGELKRRLGKRATDNTKIIRRRLANARREIQNVMQYDYYVVNRNIEEAVGLLEAIVLAERQRISRVLRWRIAPLKGESKALSRS
ncbi:MAG: guanylate kinase [Deltaproteobacteria bacterium]|nr:guanylate kinase [Deltaproteobacteria bacterium]